MVKKVHKLDVSSCTLSYRLVPGHNTLLIFVEVASKTRLSVLFFHRVCARLDLGQYLTD